MLAIITSLFFTRKSTSQTHSMATPIPTPTNDNNPNNKCDISKSRFLPTECLADWWLTKADVDSLGTVLAVSGHTLSGNQPMRFCASLPILKRHDVFTLETTDGKTVILKGFLNKDRSLENGFPSHVCNHFMFGFPDYWKTCTKPYMVKDTSPDIPTPKSGSIISGCEKNSNKINNLDGVLDSPSKVKSSKAMTPSEEISVHTQRKAKTSSGSKLGQGTTSSEAEDISIHTTKKTRTRSSLSKFGSGMTSLEGISSDTRRTRSMRQCGREGISSHTRRTRSMSKCGRGMISSEQILSDTNNEAGKRSRSRMKMKQMNVASVVPDSPLKDQLDRGMTSREKFPSDSKNEARARSLSRSVNEQENIISLAVHSGCEKTRLKSVSLSLDFDNVELADGESNQKVDSHVEDNTRLNESSKDKMNSSELVDDCSVEQIPETSTLEDDLKKVQPRGQTENNVISSLSKPVSGRKFSAKNAKAPKLSETSNLEKDMKRVQTRGLVKQKSESEATPSLSRPASGRKSSLKAKSAKASYLSETLNLEKDVGRVQTSGSKANPSHTKPNSDKRSLSKNAETSSTKRNLVYETPKREKKRLPVDSPQLSDLKRSRSGRLLSPKLEFWRNQRRICDADGTVTGIKLGMQPEQPIPGSDRKKRRQL